MGLGLGAPGDKLLCSLKLAAGTKKNWGECLEIRGILANFALVFRIRYFSFLELDIKAILFDMDGTLYDSMPNHASSWYQMVREHDIECTPEEFYLYEGATGHFTVNMLIERKFGRKATEAEVHDFYERKAEIFRVVIRLKGA